MKFHGFVAGVAFAGLTSFAHAAVIERTFDVTASSFALISGSSAPAPVDPVDLNFTLLIDTSMSVTSPSTAGFTINSFNLPDPPYSLEYTYDSGTGYLTVATYPAANDSCAVGVASYCVTVADLTGDAPVGYGATQTTDSGGIWQTGNISVTASAIGGVPEPSTWALMLIGFGGVGWLVSRRRRGEISY